LTRLAKIILGLLCLITSFWPGYIAAVLLYHVVPLGASGPAGIHDSYYIVMDPVFFGGLELQGWLIYAVPSGLGLLALGLAGAGVWLLVSRPDSPD